MSVSKTDKPEFECDISGAYELLDHCGTVCNDLHKQKGTDLSLRQLYMFFVPHRTKDSEGCFMLSTEVRRLEFGESRPFVAQPSTKRRQSNTDDSEKIEWLLPFQWVEHNAINLQVSHIAFLELMFDNNVQSSHQVKMHGSESLKTQSQHRVLISRVNIRKHYFSQCSSRRPDGRRPLGSWHEANKSNDK